MEECFTKMTLKRVVASIVWESNNHKQVVDITEIDLLCLQQRTKVINDDQCWLKDNVIMDYIHD